jgi:hypothetical protein
MNKLTFSVDGVLKVIRDNLSDATEEVREQYFDKHDQMREEMGYAPVTEVSDVIAQVINQTKAPTAPVAEAIDGEFITLREAEREFRKINNGLKMCASTIKNRIDDGEITGRKNSRGHWCVLKSEVGNLEHKAPPTSKSLPSFRAGPKESDRRRKAALDILSDGEMHRVKEVCQKMIDRPECDYSKNGNPISTAHKVLNDMKAKNEIEWLDLDGGKAGPGRNDYVFIPKAQETLQQAQQRTLLGFYRK